MNDQKTTFANSSFVNGNGNIAIMENEQRAIIDTLIKYYLKNGIHINKYYTFSSNDFLFKNGAYVLKIKTKAILAAIEVSIKFNK